MKERPELLIFDVNETLLNLEPIQNAINDALGSTEAFETWFSKLLQFSFAETLTGQYRDFGEIGTATFKMAAQKFSVEISEEKIEGILGKNTQLLPYPEVPKALETLKNSGFKLVALTNGGQKTAEKQLDHAEIKHFFDAVYSVEAVKKFKPHPEPYNYVLQKHDLKPEQAMLIAAHAWDIIGAQRVGLKTGFVSRPGKYLYPVGDHPTLIGKSVKDIAKALSNPEF